MMVVCGVRPCSSRPPSVMLLLLLVVMATGRILKNDPNCLAAGGLCVDLDSCPIASRENQTGLCVQEQQGEGVCCHEVPADSPCRQHGGRCGQQEECRNVPNFGQLDCQEGSKCCLLIF